MIVKEKSKSRSKPKANNGINFAINWEKRMLIAGKKFASITTTRAVYDRVVVVEDRPSSLIIQWLKGSAKKRNLNTANCGNDSFTVSQEDISKENIVNIRYFKD